MKVMQLLTLLFIALMFTACNSSKDVISSTEKSTELKRNEGERNSPREGVRRTPPSIDEVFKMDVNNDGLLAKSEVNERMLKRFDTMDTNEDGFISRAEFEEAPRPQKGQRKRIKN